MKNTIRWEIILFVLLIGLVSFACAESDFNINDYTDDEIINIMKAIFDSDTQTGYMYSNDVMVVGKDIPVGAYEFWVEESDISFSQKFMDDPKDYHCGNSTLCYIQWGNEYNPYVFETFEEIFYDEYNEHVKVNLEEGQFLWTIEGAAGANFEGLRMKYFPNRKSGLFAN